MAGIGFVLKKLLKKEDLANAMQAYFHAMMASSGSWLMTVIALGSFFIVFRGIHNKEAIDNFRSIILYNFSFSLVYSSPLVLIVTRYVADCIYRKDVTNIAPMTLGAMAVLAGVAFPCLAWFYFKYAILTTAVAFAATANFILVSLMWLLNVLVSAVRYYRIVTGTYLLGMGTAFIGATLLGSHYSTFGMLMGFNLGLTIIVCSLTAVIFVEYPRSGNRLFNFLRYAYQFRQIALGGLVYNLAIWIDKWLMWLAPEAEQLPNRLILYPQYDTAMFAAYLTIVPGMAMFLLSQETAFFEKYERFYRGIQQHQNFKQILANHQAILECVATSGKNLLFLQVIICFVVLLTTPFIFSVLGMDFITFGMFRVGVLGATFQILTVYLTIVLSYFDYRKGVLAIQFTFLITNTLLTLMTLKLGFLFYGYGYFLSTVISFIVAAVITEMHLRKLPYHAFISCNTSVVTKD